MFMTFFFVLKLCRKSFLDFKYRKKRIRTPYFIISRENQIFWETISWKAVCEPWVIPGFAKSDLSSIFHVGFINIGNTKKKYNKYRANGTLKIYLRSK